MRLIVSVSAPIYRGCPKTQLSVLKEQIPVVTLLWKCRVHVDPIRIGVDLTVDEVLQ